MNKNELGIKEQVDDVFFNTKDQEVYNFMLKTNRKVKKNILFSLNRPLYIALIGIFGGISIAVAISHTYKDKEVKK